MGGVGSKRGSRGGGGGGGGEGRDWVGLLLQERVLAVRQAGGQVLEQKPTAVV